MAQKADPSVYGRKIFFITPHFILKAKILRDLCQDEYEAYTIDDITKLPSLIKMFPFCVLFFNIDEGKSKQEWLSFIRGIEDSCKTVFTGVIFGTITDTQKLQYTSTLRLKAGMVDINDKQKDPLEEIKKILNDVKAKGRRRYVRCTCSKQENNEAVILVNSKNYKLKIADVSIAGISLIIPPDLNVTFAPHTVIRSIFITLGGVDFTHPMVIFGTNVEKNQTLLVLVFLPGIPNSVKTQIHKYISDTKNKELKQLLDAIH